ncbi:MAG TPA: Stk1 family PASTA domain-containing Ser/Thr kinase, partial [Actinomycetota bacterium]|nr:Stk1 family PASTA domain-containing Ser/Thr kinase [Actinomycetota bacterium]
RRPRGETIDQPVMLGGRYRVEDELGRGGMAKVYRGQDTVLGRTVAVKILAPQFADDPNFVTRFRREAQAAARISNQNLVSVFDTGSDDGVHYIVMEFVEGKTLAEFLAGGGRIMPERAIDIATDVCRALEAAHAQGVIHRDIKPGNIMLNSRGDVKVTDFGIARMSTTAETVAQTAAVLGTAAYLSPEQAQGQPVDGRTDIYSLGCVLYEMVGGRPPFTGDSPVTVASKQVLEQPTPPSKLNPDVSPDLDAVILRAMAKNPDNRYQTADELRTDLERVRRGLPVEATPLLPVAPASTQVIQRAPAPAQTAVLSSPEPEPERSRWWVPVLVTLLILGILGLALFFLARNLLQDDEEEPSVVAVPNVVGMRYGQARAILEGDDFGLVTVRNTVPPPEDDPDVEPGTVIAQDPEAETEVEPGSEVILDVVETPGTVLVPEIPEGSTVSQATATLIDAGLTPAAETESQPSEVDEGLVIGTDPPAGTEVPPESEVTIIVSSGPEPITVPNVTCINPNAALNQLRAAGLVGDLSSETRFNPSCPQGNLVGAQDPPPGTQLVAGDTVTIYRGERPPQPTGPTGTGGTGPTGDDD